MCLKDVLYAYHTYTYEYPSLSVCENAWGDHFFIPHNGFCDLDTIPSEKLHLKILILNLISPAHRENTHTPLAPPICISHV